MQRSLCLVRVPLNVEDTLSCYRQAFERRPLCLLVFQQSHTLLLRLLANTQQCEMIVDGADADMLRQLTALNSDCVSLQASWHRCTTLRADARLNSIRR